VGLRTGLDDMEKRKFLTLPGLELRPLGRPGRSQSLYRLRSSIYIYTHIFMSIWDTVNELRKIFKCSVRPVAHAVNEEPYIVVILPLVSLCGCPFRPARASGLCDLLWAGPSGMSSELWMHSLISRVLLTFVRGEGQSCVPNDL
jgi:hypothetical protein